MLKELYKCLDKKNRPYVMSMEQIDIVNNALGDDANQMLRHMGGGIFSEVFAWGDKSAVIKVPNNVPLIGHPTASQLQTEIDILNEFKIPIPKTVIAACRDIDTGVIISEYLHHFKPLTKVMLHDRSIRSQLEAILEANNAMIQTRKCSIDRVGFDVAIQSPISAARELLENNRNIPISSNLVVAKNSDGKDKIWYTDSNVLLLNKDQYPDVDIKLTWAHQCSQWFVDQAYKNVFTYRKQPTR